MAPFRRQCRPNRTVHRTRRARRRRASRRSVSRQAFVAIRYSQVRGLDPALEAFPGAPGPQEHLLDVVFGLVKGPEHPVAVHVQLAPVPADQVVEVLHPRIPSTSA